MRGFAVICLGLLVAACQAFTPLGESSFRPVGEVRGPQGGSPAILYLFGGTAYPPIDQAQFKTPKILDYFIKTGFDAYRLDLSAFDQAFGSTSMARTQETLLKLRGMGYARIYVVGQSAGGNNALISIGGPNPLADGAIAFAPGSNSRLPIQRQEILFDNVVSKAAPIKRVAIFLFDEDELLGNWHAERIMIVKRWLSGRTNAMMVVPARVRGHSGANTDAFADDFGVCLTRFLNDEVGSGKICNDPAIARDHLPQLE